MALLPEILFFSNVQIKMEMKNNLGIPDSNQFPKFYLKSFGSLLPPIA